MIISLPQDYWFFPVQKVPILLVRDNVIYKMKASEISVKYFHLIIMKLERDENATIIAPL